MTHAGEKVRFGQIGFFRDGIGFLQFEGVFLQHLVHAIVLLFDLLAQGVVGAEQQIWGVTPPCAMPYSSSGWSPGTKFDEAVIP